VRKVPPRWLTWMDLASVWITPAGVLVLGHYRYLPGAEISLKTCAFMISASFSGQLNLRFDRGCLVTARKDPRYVGVGLSSRASPAENLRTLGRLIQAAGALGGVLVPIPAARRARPSRR
jgi:hypothetical protein